MSSTDQPIIWGGKVINIVDSKKPPQARSPAWGSTSSSSSTPVVVPTPILTPEVYTPASTPYHSPRPAEPASYFVGSESEDSSDLSEDEVHPWDRRYSSSIYHDLNDLCRKQSCRLQEPLSDCLKRRGTLKTLSLPDKNVYYSNPSHICITEPKRMSPLPAGGTLAAMTAAVALSGKARARAALQATLAQNKQRKKIEQPYEIFPKNPHLRMLQESGAINMSPTTQFLR